MVQIDHRLLTPAALQDVLKDLAVRQGLDYGVGEMPLENQIQHLHNRLESSEWILVFIAKENLIDIVRFNEYARTV